MEREMSSTVDCISLTMQVTNLTGAPISHTPQSYNFLNE